MPNVVEVMPVFDLGVPGEYARVVGTFNYDTEPSDLQQGVLADAVEQWWSSGVGGDGGRNFYAPTTRLHNVEIQVVAPTRRAKYIRDVLGHPGGTDTPSVPAIACPAQCAVVLSHRTTIASRRTRGRSYWPPPNRERVGADGVIDITFRPSWKAAHVQFFRRVEDAIPALNLNHVVWSRTSDSSRIVSTYLMGARIDTQRRRLGAEQTYD